MKQNHTEGKWIYKKSSTGIMDIYDEAGRCIAGASCLCDGIDNAARAIEADANAKLIAAVPDLLTVCELAKESIYEALNNRKADLSVIWHRLETEIAKATN